ncbi:MlaD family protein [soil metagenome]
MLRSKKNDLIVGSFVLFAFAVMFTMTFAIRGGTGVSPYKLQTSYKDVAGLEIGAPVLVSGFRLGRVTSMEPGVDKDNNPIVLVNAKIARDVKIYKDAKVRLMLQGFIGDKRLEIDPGTSTNPEIENGERLEGVPPSDFTKILGKGEDIMANLNETLKNIREFTENKERIAKIDDSLANIAQSSKDIAEILKENRESIRASTENVQKLTAQARDIADKVNKTVEKADAAVTDAQAAVADLRKDRAEVRTKVDSILENTDKTSAHANELVISAKDEVKALSDKIKQASDNLNEILAKVNRGEGTVGKLVSDSKPFDDLQASIASLRTLLAEPPNTLYDRRIPYAKDGKTAAPKKAPDGAGVRTE